MFKIQILGTGCPKCRELAKQAEQAAKKLGIEFTIEKIDKIDEIMEFGVMVTPALAVNGEVKLSGKTPGVEKLIQILSESQNRK